MNVFDCSRAGQGSEKYEIRRLCRPWTARYVLFLSLAFTPSLAQNTDPSENTLPEAPSASQQKQSASTISPHDEESKGRLEILYRKSLVFHDLATSRQPLTTETKFKLFISNSVSPLSVGGALL